MATGRTVALVAGLLLTGGIATTANAGGWGFSFGWGGYCGPRYYAASYAPAYSYYRPAAYCAPAYTTYSYAAPVVYSSAPVVYTTSYATYAPAYRTVYTAPRVVYAGGGYCGPRYYRGGGVSVRYRDYDSSRVYRGGARAYYRR